MTGTTETETDTDTTETDTTDITGTDGVDLLFGTNSGETIDAGGARDYVFGGRGDDTIRGGEGSDFLFGDGGNDSIEGGEGSDFLLGDDGSDTIEGGEGHDWIWGGSGDDSLDGGIGGDFLDGGSGSDTLDGGEGSDWLTGGTGDDMLTGGAGADTFLFDTGSGNDVVTDFANGEDLIDLREFTEITSFADLTITSDGDDVVIDLSDYGGGTVRLENVSESDLVADDFVFYAAEGGDGDDRLLGASGDDTLTGGAGDDTLTGYAGDDTFVFGLNHGDDTITDFNECEDAIDLSAFSTITGTADLTITRDGCDAVIDLTDHGGGTIRLADYYDQSSTYVSQLDGTDFVFYEPPPAEQSTDGM